MTLGVCVGRIRVWFFLRVGSGFYIRLGNGMLVTGLCFVCCSCIRGRVGFFFVSFTRLNEVLVGF